MINSNYNVSSDNKITIKMMTRIVTRSRIYILSAGLMFLAFFLSHKKEEEGNGSSRKEALLL